MSSNEGRSLADRSLTSGRHTSAGGSDHIPQARTAQASHDEGERHMNNVNLDALAQGRSRSPVHPRQAPVQRSPGHSTQPGA